MSEQECGFVTKDGRLRVLRGGAIRFEGTREGCECAEVLSTMVTPELADDMGKGLREYLQLVISQGTGSTSRIACELGLVPGRGTRALRACVGADDVLITLTVRERSKTVIEYPPPYTHEEMLRVAEAMIRAAEAAKDTA